MRIAPVLTLAAVAVAVAAAACSPAAEDTANGGLVDTSWTVTAIDGVPMTARPTMSFAQDGTVSGSSGCNQYSAPFRTDGSAILIGNVASTLMGCDGDRGVQEAMFLTALQAATTWRLAADGNLVIGGAAEILAGPGVAEGPPDDEPVTDLAGSDWSLVDMGGTGDFARLVPTLHFGADGVASGFAGCNKFSGSYTVAAVELRLGPLALTKMACERPASAVEAEFVAALARVTAWTIDDAGRLVLDGAVPLTFTRN